MLPLLMSLSLFMASCDDDEAYTTSPSALLAFSADTIRFDTVFTTIGSATQLFKVYNRGDEPMMLSSIRLAGRGETGFRVNVDGLSGTEFTDVEVRDDDSLYVFVEVTVDPRNEDNPFLLRDSLQFLLQSGICQQVQLEAYGQDMIVLRGTVFSTDTTLTRARPHVVYDSLVVDSNATLSLSEASHLETPEEVQGSCHCLKRSQCPLPLEIRPPSPATTRMSL